MVKEVTEVKNQTVNTLLKISLGGGAVSAVVSVMSMRDQNTKFYL